MNLEDVIRKTSVVEEYLKAEGRYKFPLKIDDISSAIYSQKSIDITYETAPTKPECQIRSVLKKGKFSAEIRYNHSLNPCWTRFSICKELCHVLIDTQKSATKDIVQLVSLLVAKLPHEITDSYSESESYASEKLAEFGALEILFPIAHRKEIVKKIAEGEYKKTNSQIAKEYKIPEHYISTGLDPAYLKIMNSVYSEIKK